MLELFVYGVFFACLSLSSQLIHRFGHPTWVGQFNRTLSVFGFFVPVKSAGRLHRFSLCLSLAPGPDFGHPRVAK